MPLHHIPAYDKLKNGHKIAVKVGLGAAIFGLLFWLSPSFRTAVTTPAGGKATASTEGLDVRPFKNPAQCEELRHWGIPKYEDPKVAKRSYYFCTTTYFEQYDFENHVPLWVTQRIEQSQVADEVYFEGTLHPNTKIPKKHQNDLNDFGTPDAQNLNMVPRRISATEDQRISTLGVSAEELKETKMLASKQASVATNVIPMHAALADGFWPMLEAWVRREAVKKGSLLITTGPLYLNGPSTPKIGKTWVPSHFFKTISVDGSWGGVTLIIPNKEIVLPNRVATTPDALTCKEGCRVENFVVPIRELERLAGRFPWTPAQPNDAGTMLLYPLLSPENAAQIKLDSRYFNAGQ